MARGFLRINPHLVLPESEIDERFSPSGGPGGQHANRAHSRVDLRFNIAESESLTDEQRLLLTRRFGGDVRATAEDSRSQRQNREVARERLSAKIRQGLQTTKRRKPTRPSRGSSERRLTNKRERAEIKQARRKPTIGDD